MINKILNQILSRVPLLLMLISSVALLVACGQVAIQPTSIPSSMLVPTIQTASVTPGLYITPTPDFGLPGEEIILEQAVVAGTATRAAQLTSIPTWPPDVPRPHPSQSPSTPVVIAVPSQVAGNGIIYNTDVVGVGAGLDIPSQLGLFLNEWDTQINEHYIEVLAGTKSAPSPSERAKGIV